MAIADKAATSFGIDFSSLIPAVLLVVVMVLL